MTYPGGKGGAGVYQKIINLMPPHQVYIEPFLGAGSVMRKKRPAPLNIGVDLDLKAVMAFPPNPKHFKYSDDPRHPVELLVYQDNALSFLSRYKFKGTELVYCDPPYILSTRTRRQYTHEMTDKQHQELLSIINRIPCNVIISGYESTLYTRKLKKWRHLTFQAMTRGGRTATEHVWCNFSPPPQIHDYQHLGADFRERERIKRKKGRLVARLARMPQLERQALIEAIREVWGLQVDRASPNRAIEPAPKE